MRSPCIASWASKRSPRIARTGLQGRCTWSWTCDQVRRESKIMKKLYLLLSVALFAAASFAADSKSVSYKSGDEPVQAVLYTPAGKGPFPAIIVIHEWWGLNNWVKDQASKLADQGYVALAIDLYRGKVATTPDEAHQIMRGVPEDR